MKDLETKLLIPVLKRLAEKPIVIDSRDRHGITGTIGDICTALATRGWANQSWNDVMAINTWEISPEGRETLVGELLLEEHQARKLAMYDAPVRCTGMVESRANPRLVNITLTDPRTRHETVLQAARNHRYELGKSYLLDPIEISEN